MSQEIEVTVDRSLDLFAVMRQLWRRRLTIVLTSLVVGAGFTTYAFLATPIFKASAVLVSASQDRQDMQSGLRALSQLGGLAALTGINFGDPDSDTEEALAVLKSRQFIKSFVDDKGLLPVLFAEKWDADKKAWSTPMGGEPTDGDAYRYFTKEIMSVEKDKRTNLITVAISWRNPEAAANWVNEIIERLNTEMRTRAIEKANASLKHLQHELEQTSEIGTRDAINRLAETQIKQRMLANVNKEYIFRFVDKAVTPELKEKVWPKRMLLVSLGFLVGGVLACGAVLVIERKDA